MQPFFETILRTLSQISAQFLEVRDGIHKAIQIAPLDPEMALTRARKVLEHVVRDVYLRHCNEEPGTRPLENLIDRIVKEGYFPRRLQAYATSIRMLGNVGTHSFGEKITTSDVYLSLTQLMPILEWFFDEECAPAGGPKTAPSSGQPADPSVVSGWGQFTDPDNDCAWRLQDGKLTLLVPGAEHDLGILRNLMNAPRVLQPVEGDFTLQVTVAGSFRPWDQTGPQFHAFHGAGLLLFGDETTFIRLERATARRTTTHIYCNYELRSKEKTRLSAVRDAAEYQLKDYLATRLQLCRCGEVITAKIAQADEPWRNLPPTILSMPKRVHVGVAAVTTATEAFAPVFYDLRLERPVTTA